MAQRAAAMSGKARYHSKGIGSPKVCGRRLRRLILSRDTNRLGFPKICLIQAFVGNLVDVLSSG